MMRQMLGAAAAGFVLVCMGVGAPVASASDKVASGEKVPVTNYLFCTAMEEAYALPDESMSQPAIYYSAPFMVVTDNLNPVYEAFFKFLKDKYAYAGEQSPGSGQQCYGLHSLEEAAENEQMKLKKSQQYPQQKVVETGWTYSAAQ